MGVGFERHQLVHRVNQAFQPANIAASAAVAATLPETADAYDILHSLDLFQFPQGVTLDSYRRSLPIPALNNAIMTLAFQTAVKTRTPLSFWVVSGDSEQVLVTTSATQIIVVLTRKD